MVQLWVIFGLVVSAVAISALGATFSIIGIGKLFAGATLAVWVMAASMEFAKFTVAAYLHQTWKDQSRVFRFYLVGSVVTLSLITSMGIYGFLSDAYSSTSSVLEAEEVKLERLTNEQALAKGEIDRLEKTVNDIPDKRISKRLRARAETEPMIRELQGKLTRAEMEIAEIKVKIIDVKQKVGPLLYIAKAFAIDIDTIVKYFVFLLVLVFDPLAICLVIAISDAVKRRQAHKPLPSFKEGFASAKRPIAVKSSDDEPVINKNVV